MPANNPLGLDLELANIDPVEMDDQDEWATPKAHTCELWVKSASVPFWAQQMMPGLLQVLMEKHFDQPPQVHPIERPWGTFIVYLWDDSAMAKQLADTGYFEKQFDYTDMSKYEELKDFGGYQVKLKFRLAERHLENIIKNLNPPKKTLRPKEVKWAEAALERAKAMKDQIKSGKEEVELSDGSMREVTDVLKSQLDKEITWLEEALAETAKANADPQGDTEE